MNPPPYASILITGASSGIGRSLALALAAPGVTLALGGRDHSRLAAVAAACAAQGAEARTASIDVTDGAAMETWVLDRDDARPLDLVIANAGISSGTGDGGEDPEQTRRIFAVNLDGVLNTALPALPRMLDRGAGHIALMSSLAGFLPLPGAPAYAASKAAVRIWGEGLAGWVAPRGVAVSIICPGFIATPLTAVNRFPMPFLMQAEPAARVILRGLVRRERLIAFPWATASAVRALSKLPDWMTRRLMAALPAKEG